MDINTKKAEADLQTAKQRAIETLSKISSDNLNKKSKAITAEEALAIANSSEVVKKRISKMIREVATEGFLQASYGFEHPSRILVDSIVKDLTERGFKVTVVDEEDFVHLTISWDI
jgi:hypothetical protein